VVNSARKKKKEKEKEREREREVELEAALYTNCLLLMLHCLFLTTMEVHEQVSLNIPIQGWEKLCSIFLLCALRGPSQSAKNFAGVWPIFDSAESRVFSQNRARNNKQA